MNKPSERRMLVRNDDGTWSTIHPWWINVVPLRLQVAWHVLRGRPVAYGLTIHGGLVFDKGVFGSITNCHINIGAVAKAGVTIGGDPVKV